MNGEDRVKMHADIVLPVACRSVSFCKQHHGVGNTYRYRDVEVSNSFVMRHIFRHVM
jgi:hypothetical protein